MKQSRCWVFIVLLSACSQQVTDKTEAKTDDSSITFNEEFVHNVYFWLKNPESPEDRLAFEKSIKKLLANSLYAETNFLATSPTSAREVVDDSYTYHLLITFPSAEAQDSYQTEEAHLLFIEESASLWERVVVYDSEVIN